MKIFITGNKSIVSSVYVSKGPIGLDVLINTRDRYQAYQYRGGWCSGLTPEIIEAVGHHQLSCFEFSNPEDEKDICGVAILSETEEERSLFNGMRYEQSEKDQVSFIFVRPELLLDNTEEIIDYRVEAVVPKKTFIQKVKQAIGLSL